LGEFRLGYISLGWKYSRKDLFRFRFYSSHCIYHRSILTYRNTAFTALIDICFTAEKKATPPSIQGVGVDIKFICIPFLHNVTKRVRNGAAQ
jgi:hypothetical protein